VCSSDLADAKDAEREIKLWFKPADIVGDLFPTKKVVIQAHEEIGWA
jgi:nucleoside-diphosphate kinase